MTMLNQKFESYINKLKAQKAVIERTNIEGNLFFSTQKKTNHLKILNAWLESLRKYEQRIQALIKVRPENKEFYEAYFEAVINMLENLDNKKNTLFTEEDFEFKRPENIRYNENGFEIADTVIHDLIGGAMYAGFLGEALLGLSLIILILFLNPLALHAISDVLFILIFSVPSTFAVIGAIANPLVRYWSEGFFEDGHCDSLVIDLNLLKSAYDVLSETGVYYNLGSANDPIIEPKEDSQTLAGFTQ